VNAPRVLLHAPTAGALARARSNARNLKRLRPEAEVAIVVNAGGVEAALDAPDPETDGHLHLCANTLARLGRPAPAGIATVEAAVLHLVEAQAEGWTYVRA
jgi:NitT/TauT family transport system ATP-binding protein